MMGMEEKKPMLHMEISSSVAFHLCLDYWVET